MRFSLRHQVLWWAVCLGIAVVLVHLKFGLQVLNPRHTSWLYVLNSDWIQHYFGWSFFRQADWSFPPGKLSGYGYPMLSSIGYTDSIPLFAFLFKFLSAWLPTPFQYFGWWFLVCYFLQGWFAAKLLKVFNLPLLVTFLGTLLFMFSPVLLARTGHPALCAQWTLLALIWSYYRPGKPALTTIPALVIVLLAALIHPYLLAMNMALYLAVLLRLHYSHVLPWRQLGAYFAAAVVGAATIFYLVGYFLIPSDRTAGSGVGHFSANLNTFFNPLDTSSWLNALPLATSGQYEGYGYLGLAVIGVFVGALYYYRHQVADLFAMRLPASILFYTCVLLFIFALSPVMTLMSHKLVELPLRNYFTQTFRSSGRFVWPLHYFLLVCIIRALNYSRFRSWVSNISMGLLLVLHVLEFRPLLRPHYIDHHAAVTGSLTASVWKELLNPAKRLWVFPPYQPKIRYEGDIIYFQHLAMERNLPLSTGTFARRDDREAKARQDTIQLQLSGQLPAEAGDVFLCGPQHLDLIKAPGEILVLDEYVFYIPQITLELDTFWMHWLNQHAEIRLSGKKIFKLEDYLLQYQDKLVLLSVKDEATQSLCESTKNYFKASNSQLANLTFRGSYAGAWYQGRPLKEVLNNYQAVSLSFNLTETVPAWSNNKMSILLQSAGNAVGNNSNILLGNQEHSAGQRGFNIVVIDSTATVIKSFFMDTYQSCYQFQ